MEKLGKYTLTTKMSNQNGGYSMWCFGRKDGKEYFIKEFLSPKYPVNDTVSSPERIEKRKRQCARFEAQRKDIYQRLNANSDGNAVRVTDFFRVDSKYYMTMPKINAVSVDIETVSAMTENDKRFLCAVIAHSIIGLHQAGIIHADLKHSNIMFTHSTAGNLTAKIIDFDSSFLETDPPQAGDEIVGDQVYFSPEACKSIFGETVPLTCKMDMFALGVLFHQYFTGSLPFVGDEPCPCCGAAVASGETVTVCADLPPDIHALLTRMLDENYEKRPCAREVYCILTGQPYDEIPVTPKPPVTPKSDGTWWYRVGDL